MKYYTPDMFDYNKIGEIFKPLYMKKETLEFQMGIYQDKLDTYKKLNFPEMLVYERKKEQNPTLIPDKVVLQQFKELEKEPAISKFNKTITQLKRDIKNIDQEIDNQAKKISNMFSFKEKNYEIYLEYLNRYYLGVSSFTELMELIFTNEFNDKKIYYEVAALRNMPVLNLLYQRSPVQYREFMRNICDEAAAYYKLEEIKLIYELDLMVDKKIDIFKLSCLVRAKYAELLGEQQ
jgi:hypothetical protein